MVLGAIDDPSELVHDLLDGWLTVAAAQELLEDPGVSERPAGQQDRRSTRLLVRGPRLLGARQAAGQQDRGGQCLHELARQRVVRRALVLLGGMARMQPDTG